MRRFPELQTNIMALHIRKGITHIYECKSSGSETLLCMITFIFLCSIQLLLRTLSHVSLLNENHPSIIYSSNAKHVMAKNFRFGSKWKSVKTICSELAGCSNCSYFVFIFRIKIVVTIYNFFIPLIVKKLIWWSLLHTNLYLAWNFTVEFSNK